MLQVRPHGIGQAIGQVHQSDQHVEIEYLFFREVRPKSIDIPVVDVMHVAGEFVGKLQRRLLLGTEAAKVPLLERLPVLLDEPDSLRRSEMML